VTTCSRTFEATFESQRAYADPFNDVEVDAIFSKDAESWRVPCFWSGEQKWTVRFSPPAPGAYGYELECTDSSNPELNARADRVTITPYDGTNTLLRRGMLRLSESRRHLEHADGTPFYWLGDTWWTGLSDRLPWEGFQRLVADRRDKGFTLVQIVGGLVPFEELAPIDPGFHNEGGTVWDPEFTAINPGYFDYADRRIQLLVDSGIVPAIVGAWREVLGQMGTEKMKKHWRNLIARYGAYPVIWIVGGEVIDPPSVADFGHPPSSVGYAEISGGWTDVARYIRDTDPYHHPLTVHEFPPPWDVPLQDESLSDLDLLQPGHFGWASIAASVAQVNMHRARTTIRKPVVVGEIGYEKLSESHLEDFQRAAFWLSMLNGAAGHTYGAAGTWESYTAAKPFHRRKWSYLTWEEGMNLPGSYQVGLGARLLQRFPWWRFEPHPEWVSPRGTTLFEPRDEVNGFDFAPWQLADDARPSELTWPGGEWQARDGNWRLPYAAGIPAEVRVVYIPYLGLVNYGKAPPTILGLEVGVRYRAYYWEPGLGVTIDLGIVERPAPGAPILTDTLEDGGGSNWSLQQGEREHEGMLAVLAHLEQTNLIATVDAAPDAETRLVLRYRGLDDYLLGVYSPKAREIYVLERNGADATVLGRTPLPDFAAEVQLRVEVRGAFAAVCVTDGHRTVTTPIVPINNSTPGAAGFVRAPDSHGHRLRNFALRRSPTLVSGEHLERELYDARGEYRGALSGPGWEDFGREKVLLLDAYRPPDLPHPQDWVLVLERS
jgi:hypothetical protein